LYAEQSNPIQNNLHAKGLELESIYTVPPLCAADH